MSIINVLGFDPAMRNWGIAEGTYNTVTGEVLINRIDVAQPVVTTSKQVRQNSKDLETAEQLCARAVEFARNAHAIFVEVPVGSQSARSMCSYGMCVGILGALRAGGIPFFEVTATEVKLAGAGKKSASKAEMIAWGTEQYPHLNWPTYKRHGQTLISESSAEHMADAIAAILAGIQTVPFKQALPFMKVVA